MLALPKYGNIKYPWLFELPAQKKETFSWLPLTNFWFYRENLWEENSRRTLKWLRSLYYYSHWGLSLSPLSWNLSLSCELFHQYNVAEMTLCNFWRWPAIAQKLPPLIFGRFFLWNSHMSWELQVLWRAHLENQTYWLTTQTEIWEQSQHQLPAL